MEAKILKWMVILAGIGQILTALLYPFVRYRVLDWFSDLQNLKPLNAAIAKTYGYYIQGINFSFGMLSIVLVNDLLVASNLTIAIAFLFSVYWWGRISFQLKSYSFADLTGTKNLKVGIWTMNMLIVYFALTYTLLLTYLLIQY